jgi:Squalene/phytoene synthase
MQDAFSYCAELVRTADRDRFLATLFAPAGCRDALHALYAFDIEVARVSDLAREAIPGEIRLQWWREVLQGERGGEASASPVAAALLSALDGRRFSTDSLLSLIDAHRFDLYNEPMATVADLERYTENTTSALIAAAARILGVDAAAAARPVGIAQGIARALAALPRQAAQRGLARCRARPSRHGRKSLGDAIARVLAGLSCRCAAATVARPLGAMRCFRAHRTRAVAASMVDLARVAKPGPYRNLKDNQESESRRCSSSFGSKVNRVRYSAAAGTAPASHDSRS